MYPAHKNIKITDFNNICRTCLHSDDLKPIEDYVIIETLQRIADIAFVENDEYPQKICDNCLKKLYEIQVFAVQCKEIDGVLKTCLNLNNEEENVKTELYEHKHFLAMETEESSSNDSNNQDLIPKVNYHKNLLKQTINNASSSTHETPEIQEIQNQETQNEDVQEIEEVDESILKQMLKDKETKSDLTYECGLCLKQFPQINQFILHQSEHNTPPQDAAPQPQTKPEKFQCLICFKTFKDGTYLIRHGRVHGNRPYKCDQCDKAYIESGHLVVHKRTHTGERPFVCESCPKAFVSLSNLVKHRVVHTGLRKIFTCDICGKEMNDPSNLRKHRRVHTKEKPFKCKYCETAFSGASDLRAHERLHTGERPYACDLCSRKFSRSTYLNKHKKTCVELMRIKNETASNQTDNAGNTVD